MDRKTQFYQDVSSSHLDLHIQGSPNQNPSKLSCGCGKTDFKVYTERQKNQKSQHDTEGQHGRTGTARLQDFQ